MGPERTPERKLGARKKSKLSILHSIKNKKDKKNEVGKQKEARENVRRSRETWNKKKIYNTARGSGDHAGCNDTNCYYNASIPAGWCAFACCLSQVIKVILRFMLGDGMSDCSDSAWWNPVSAYRAMLGASMNPGVLLFSHKRN